jgi:hypothetical protein
MTLSPGDRVRIIQKGGLGTFPHIVVAVINDGQDYQVYPELSDQEIHTPIVVSAHLIEAWPW